MATTVRTTRMTADEFYADPDVPERSELVHGKVRVMAPAANAHTLVCRALFLALYNHVTPRKLGEVYPDGFGYELPAWRDVVRVPDASFVRAGRGPAALGRRGCVRLAPDLAVEVLSDSDTHTVIEAKVADFFGAGTPLMWLVDLDRRGVEVRTPDGRTRWVPESQELDGGAVLPEFRVPVASLLVGFAPDA